MAAARKVAVFYNVDRRTSGYLLAALYFPSRVTKANSKASFVCVYPSDHLTFLIAECLVYRNANAFSIHDNHGHRVIFLEPI